MRELGKRCHLIGIAGDGMSGLARLFLEAGMAVSGSDLRDSPRLSELRAAGATVFQGHAASQIPPGTGAVVFSSAVAPDNPELVAAKKGGLLVRPRIYALGEMVRGRHLIAVVGTHGKTTTTTWLSHLLRTVSGDCGYYVGADLPNLASAKLGKEKEFVAEVDESDGRFTALRADMAVLTCVDSDHLGTYGDMQSLLRAFGQFLVRARQAVVCLDDPGARKLLPLRPDAITYGLSPAATVQGQDPVFHLSQATFTVRFHGRRVGEVELPAPGVHNVKNALAALAAGLSLGLPIREMMAALKFAPRPHRRLEVLEENGYLVVDDYAHHPSEIAAGIAALRAGWPERRIVAIFQPHRFSRTAKLHRELGQALASADEIVVTDIYPAFEAPIPGVTGEKVAEAARLAGGKVAFHPTLALAMEKAAEVIQPGDVVACFGAGDIWQLARTMAQSLSHGS